MEYDNNYLAELLRNHGDEFDHPIHSFSELDISSKMLIGRNIIEDLMMCLPKSFNLHDPHALIKYFAKELHLYWDNDCTDMMINSTEQRTDEMKKAAVGRWKIPVDFDQPTESDLVNELIDAFFHYVIPRSLNEIEYGISDLKFNTIVNTAERLIDEGDMVTRFEETDDMEEHYLWTDEQGNEHDIETHPDVLDAVQLAIDEESARIYQHSMSNFNKLVADMNSTNGASKAGLS